MVVSPFFHPTIFLKWLALGFPGICQKTTGWERKGGRDERSWWSRTIILDLFKLPTVLGALGKTCFPCNYMSEWIGLVGGFFTDSDSTMEFSLPWNSPPFLGTYFFSNHRKQANLGTLVTGSENYGGATPVVSNTSSVKVMENPPPEN